MNSREYEIIMNSRKLLKTEEKENVEVAIEQLEELANEKNKYALYELATLYKEGKYVEKNIKKACNLYIFSGELGNFKSFYEAGKIFLKSNEIETAIRFFEKAKFSPEAFLELGKITKRKKTAYHKAISYFVQASKLGSPEADYILAETYILGLGTKVDINKGKYYFSRATRKGIKDTKKLKSLLVSSR